MKLITPKNVKVFSSSFHGLFAGVVVLALLAKDSSGHMHMYLQLILWAISVSCACYFGWLLGSWYVPIKGERWWFVPYIATPIISLFSALASSSLFMLVIDVMASAQHAHDLVGGGINIGRVIYFVFYGGFFVGLGVFVSILPVTIILGIGVALYLHKFGGYKDVL